MKLLKDNQEPYTVFTPYSRKWKAKLNDFYLSSYPTEKYLKHFINRKPDQFHTLESMGFQNLKYAFPVKGIARRDY